MKARLMILVAAAAAGSLLSIRCGGGGAPATDAAGGGGLRASSTSSADSLLNALEGLLDSDTAGGTARIDVRSLTPRVGSFSRAGCFYNADVKRMLLSLSRVRAPLCYIKTAEEAQVGFEIPEEGYRYYSVLPPQDVEHPQEGSTFRIRIGLFANADGNKCLKFQACNGGVEQTESFRFCETAGGMEAAIEHKFRWFDPNTQEFRTGAGSIAFDVLGKSADSLTSATVSNAFDDEAMRGSGIFTRNEEGKNSFLGRFSGGFGGFNNNGGVCVMAKEGAGAAHAQGTASYPAWQNPSDGQFYCPPQGPEQPPQQVSQGTICSSTFNHSESFAYSAPLGYFVVAASSPYDAYVAACSIPEQPTAPSPFGEEWDCAAPGGFTEIGMAALDVSACRALEESNRSDEQGASSCDRSAREKEQSNPM